MFNKIKSSSAGDEIPAPPNANALLYQNLKHTPPAEVKPEKAPSTASSRVGQAGQAKRKLPLEKILVAGIVILITLFAFGLIAYLMVNKDQVKTQAITNYDECVAAGNPVMESYPEQCAAPNGQTFTRKLTAEEQKKLDPPPTTIPDLTPFPTLSASESATWKTYVGETNYTNDGSSKFTIKYPAEWYLEGKRLYPLGKNPKQKSYNGTDIRITLGASGNGAMISKEQKSFPSGTFSYSWDNESAIYASLIKNNIAYIFVVEGMFGEDEEKYEEVFNKMLSTFQTSD